MFRLIRYFIISIFLIGLLSCAGLKPKWTESPDIDRSHRIEYTDKRIALLKDYAEAHYADYYTAKTGSSEMPGIKIDPKVIVIHYTAIPSLEKTINLFQSDTLIGRRFIQQAGAANVGVQFVVDQDGTIYQLTEANMFARHCIGLNHCAIGIENIGMGDITKDGLRGKAQKNHALTLQQVKANVSLIRMLKKEFPDLKILIGHMEYRQLENPAHPGHAFFQEDDPDYRTDKIDPGSRFMKALRRAMPDLLQPGTGGQVFRSLN